MNSENKIIFVTKNIEMLKNLFLLLIIITSFSCKNQNNKNYYEIKGHINGTTDNKLILNKIRNGELIKTDSSYMKNGDFKFKHVKINSPEMFYIVSGNEDYTVQFFADPHDITINADIKTGNLELKGSRTHAEFVSFSDNNNVYETKRIKIEEQRNLAIKNNDTALLNSSDSAYANILSEEINFMKKYALENNESFVSLYITTYQLSDYLTFEETDSIFSNFRDTLKQSVYYKELKDIINAKRKTQTGMQSPDFSLPDTSGTPVSLASLQDKYVLLCFTDLHNKICTEENRKLQKIYNENKIKDFEILSVLIENDKQRMINSVKNNNINWIAVSDLKSVNSDILKLYAVRKLPYYFLLDKNGIILKKGNKADSFIKIPDKLPETP